MRIKGLLVILVVLSLGLSYYYVTKLSTEYVDTSAYVLYESREAYVSDVRDNICKTNLQGISNVVLKLESKGQVVQQISKQDSILDIRLVTQTQPIQMSRILYDQSSSEALFVCSDYALSATILNYIKEGILDGE